MKQEKRIARGRNSIDDELEAIDEEVGKLVAPPGMGSDLRPTEERDAFTRKLMEDERAFLNPDEWGIDLRPIVEKVLNPPDDPDGLSDSEVRGYLRCLVDLLARYHLCLTSTNHLSDRELYRKIKIDVLAEPVGIGADPVGGLLYHECCPCDSDAYLMYYADDACREETASEFNLALPERKPLVSDRDTWIELLAESYRFEPLPRDDHEEEGTAQQSPG